MNKVNSYILKNFTNTFVSIFFTLFFMASIILFIRISKITSVIKLDFFELGKLYIYMLPNILMYTLPVTFFIGIVISLFKMSKENEMTVLFSLGYSPRKIAKFYFRFSFLITIALLLNSIFLILQKIFGAIKLVISKSIF